MSAPLPGESIALIHSSVPSDWLSCREIHSGLLEVYRDYFPAKTRVFDFGGDQTEAQVERLATRIREFAPDRICFLNHWPHPRRLLLALAKKYGQARLPELVFHFTEYPEEWLGLERILRSTPVRWVCASERHAKQLGMLIRGQRHLVTCPYPVRTSLFRFDPVRRARARKGLGIAEDEAVILYAGRISTQKNVVALLDEVLRWVRSSHGKARFLVAGKFDDFGAHLFGIAPALGTSFVRWQESLSKWPESLRNRVSYLGHLDAEALAEVYNVADAYASLSLHHDEDFGLAAAEALCCGTPVLLTDWGGYSSMGGHPGSAEFIPVELTRSGIELGLESFPRKLDSLLKRRNQPALREARSRHYHARFSPAAVARRLEEASRTPGRCIGLSPELVPFLKKLSIWRKEGGALFDSPPRSGTSYARIKRPYYEKRI